MKRNHPLSLSKADKPPKAPKQESSSPSTQSRSPYLRAILSGTREFFAPDKNLPVTNPDREAALRYIKESSFLKKFYIEKMSC